MKHKNRGWLAREVIRKIENKQKREAILLKVKICFEIFDLENDPETQNISHWYSRLLLEISDGSDLNFSPIQAQKDYCDLLEWPKIQKFARKYVVFIEFSKWVVEMNESKRNAWIDKIKQMNDMAILKGD